MRTLGLVLFLGIVLMAVSLLPAAERVAAAIEVEVGDYWEYKGNSDLEGMSANVTLKMKVTSTEGSGANEIFVITMSGSGQVSGTFGLFTINADMTYSGEMRRLKSNLSLLSSDIEAGLSMETAGQTATMTMSVAQTNNPALDDYIGDDNPGHGGTLTSESNVTMVTKMKMEMGGMAIIDEVDSSWYLVSQTIHIAASNETVTVPAGTFECYKYTCSLEMNGSAEEVLTYYYSDKVGNFVKMEGSSSMMAGLGNAELKAYSYRGSGTGSSSLFSGTNLLIIVLIIVAVIVVVLLILMIVRRGRAVAPIPMQPPETGPPPPGT